MQPMSVDYYYNDYRILVGQTELRVQKTRRVAGPAIGEHCGLNFTRPHWYALA